MKLTSDRLCHIIWISAAQLNNKLGPVRGAGHLVLSEVQKDASMDGRGDEGHTSGKMSGTPSTEMDVSQDLRGGNARNDAVVEDEFANTTGILTPALLQKIQNSTILTLTHQGIDCMEIVGQR